MIKAWIKQQEFLPGRLGWLVNPFYFVRRGLSSGIKPLCSEFSGRILDLGCGKKPYRSFFKVSEYIGVDIENSGHPHLNEQIDVFYDGKTLPFADQSFDGIFCSEVIEHITYLDQVVGEMKRVLKPGGKLLITCPFVWSEHELPHDYRRFTAMGLSGFLKSRGFTVLKCEKTTTDCQTLFQNLTMLIANGCGKNRYCKWIAQLALIAPIQLLGIICSIMVPNAGIFYSNTILLAQKD